MQVLPSFDSNMYNITKCSYTFRRFSFEMHIQFDECAFTRSERLLLLLFSVLCQWQVPFRGNFEASFERILRFANTHEQVTHSDICSFSWLKKFALYFSFSLSLSYPLISYLPSSSLDNSDPPLLVFYPQQKLLPQAARNSA